MTLIKGEGDDEYIPELYEQPDCPQPQDFASDGHQEHHAPLNMPKKTGNPNADYCMQCVQEGEENRCTWLHTRPRPCSRCATIRRPNGSVGRHCNQASAKTKAQGKAAIRKHNLFADRVSDASRIQKTPARRGGEPSTNARNPAMLRNFLQQQTTAESSHSSPFLPTQTQVPRQSVAPFTSASDAASVSLPPVSHPATAFAGSSSFGQGLKLSGVQEPFGKPATPVALFGHASTIGAAPMQAQTQPQRTYLALDREHAPLLSQQERPDARSESLSERQAGIIVEQLEKMREMGKVIDEKNRLIEEKDGALRDKDRLLEGQAREIAELQSRSERLDRLEQWANSRPA